MPDLVTVAHDIVISLIIIVVVWLVSRGLIKAITVNSERSQMQSFPVRRIREAIRLCSVFVTLALIVDFTNIGGEYVDLTFSGILALIGSLAFSTTLTNVISGLILFHDGFVQEGDSIEVGGATGKIVRISLRTSYLETSENNFVAISNQRMLQGPLTNYSRQLPLEKAIEGKQVPPSKQ
jgi:small-conductance mechanosensitive channel